jgi:hypothetical protein
MQYSNMKVRVLSVLETATVKQFLVTQGLPYTKGCAYYQLIKKEVIQDAKAIVVRRKAGGDILTGAAVRDVLGVPAETTAFTLNFADVVDFDVFVQSTSPVRKLLAGTDMLYDVGDGEGVEVLEAITMPVTAITATTATPELPTTTLPLEVVITFDTTGSMYPCLTQVRTHVRTLIRELFADIPNIRIAIIAHGDYGDVYVTKHTNLLADQEELCRFVETVGATCGSDWEECYELVLKEAHTKISWTPMSRKALILIGDAVPHAALSSRNAARIDWRTEAAALVAKGVTIYSVQALGNRRATDAFWRPLAHETGGIHLSLDQFSHTKEYIKAICLHTQSQDSLQSFRASLAAEGRMNRSLHGMFVALLRDTTTFAGEDHGLEAVAAARFQVLEVGADKISIKQFALDNGLTFKVGRGFYEFTKPEVISEKKEIVLMCKRSGDMFTGGEAARLVGVGSTGGRLRPTDLERWRVFVQSTSANRVLMPHTGFLYEVMEE